MPDNAVPGDAADARIPSRSTQWETPFSDTREANADQDATREVLTFSSRRRKIAIGVTVVLALWVIAEIVHVADLATPSAEEQINPFGFLNYGTIFFRLAVGGLITWQVWKWANRPVE